MRVCWRACRRTRCGSRRARTRVYCALRRRWRGRAISIACLVASVAFAPVMPIAAVVAAAAAACAVRARYAPLSVKLTQGSSAQISHAHTQLYLP